MYKTRRIKKVLIIVLCVIIAGLLIFTAIRIAPNFTYAKPIATQMSAYNKDDVAKYDSTILPTNAEWEQLQEDEFVAQVTANLSEELAEEYRKTYREMMEGYEETETDLNAQKALLFGEMSGESNISDDAKLDFYVTDKYHIPVDRRETFEAQYGVKIDREDSWTVKGKLYASESFFGRVGGFFGVGNSVELAYDVAKIDGEWKFLILHIISMEERLLNAKEKNPDNSLFQMSDYGADFCVDDEDF